MKLAENKKGVGFITQHLFSNLQITDFQPY